MNSPVTSFSVIKRCKICGNIVVGTRATLVQHREVCYRRPFHDTTLPATNEAVVSIASKSCEAPKTVARICAKRVTRPRWSTCDMCGKHVPVSLMQRHRAQGCPCAIVALKLKRIREIVELNTAASASITCRNLPVQFAVLEDASKCVAIIAAIVADDALPTVSFDTHSQLVEAWPTIEQRTNDWLRALPHLRKTGTSRSVVTRALNSFLEPSCSVRLPPLNGSSSRHQLEPGVVAMARLVNDGVLTLDEATNGGRHSSPLGHYPSAVRPDLR